MLLLLLALLALVVSHRGSIPLLLIIFLSWICLHQDAGQELGCSANIKKPAKLAALQTWLQCKLGCMHTRHWKT